MAPMLYKKNISPPSRAVLLTAKALEIDMDFTDIEMASGEHMEAEFLEKNPQHTIPVLDDDGFVVVDSGAIMIYLATKYGENFDLYPEDPEARSLVHHRLFFNCGTLQSLIGQIVRAFFFEGITTIDERVVDRTIAAYNVLEKFLGDREWMVGDTTTLADLALISSVSSLHVLVPIDEEACPKLMEWFARMEEQPYYEANSVGLDDFKAMHEKALGGGD